MFHPAGCAFIRAQHSAKYVLSTEIQAVGYTDLRVGRAP